MVLRYAPGHNPNGSQGDIAGVRNEAGNVFGLMPHPEHAVDPLTGSTYELAERERHERGIGTLPKSLRQAISELDNDPIVRAALGDHIYHAYRDAKLEEYERYRRAVHPWEHRAYLRLY